MREDFTLAVILSPGTTTMDTPCGRQITAKIPRPCTAASLLRIALHGVSIPEEVTTVKNTEIHFLYRDASNYKKYNTVVVAGAINAAQIERIRVSLNEGEYFIPEQIGLPCERFDDVTWDDHCWCELDPEYDIAPTDADVTVDLTVEELVKAFEAAAGKWDDVKYAIMPQIAQ